MLAAVVLVLGGCDDEPEPNDCAAWLDCYNRCDPWAAAGPELAGGITQCEVDCRAELDHRADEPAVQYVPGEATPGVGFVGVVHAELAAADALGDAARVDELAAALQQSLRKRAACVSTF